MKEQERYQSFAKTKQTIIIIIILQKKKAHNILFKEKYLLEPGTPPALFPIWSGSLFGQLQQVTVKQNCN